MTKLYKTLLLSLACATSLQAAEFTEQPHPKVANGNVTESTIGGHVTQKFHDTRYVEHETNNQGGAGGSAHIHLDADAALSSISPEVSSAATDEGDSEAQYELAECYQYGRGIEKDEKKAQRYDKLASKQGYEAVTAVLNEVRDITISSSIPAIARGYEAVYNRFINGKLIFDNTENIKITQAYEAMFSETFLKKIESQRKEFPLSAFATTLSGEFDLSGLTNYYKGYSSRVGGNLRIKIGYRTEQENDGKVTCWLLPKFMWDTLESTHPWKHSKVQFKAGVDVGLFWSCGNHDLESFDYLVTRNFDEISSDNLFMTWRCGRVSDYGGCGSWLDEAFCEFYLHF